MLTIPDPSVKISQHFTWKDALWLHQWNRQANESDGVTQEILDNLLQLAQKMELIRTYLGNNFINVHCMYRSPNYNLLIGAPENDVHSQGMAIDFDLNPNLTCDQVKANLMSELVIFGIRMEDNGLGANWVHIDIHPVMHSRFFKP